jgi:hypothetical protein
MGKRNIAFYYEKLSPEDQHTFNRWLKANAIGGGDIRDRTYRNGIGGIEVRGAT